MVRHIVGREGGQRGAARQQERRHRKAVAVALAGVALAGVPWPSAGTLPDKSQEPRASPWRPHRPCRQGRKRRGAAQWDESPACWQAPPRPCREQAGTRGRASWETSPTGDRNQRGEACSDHAGWGPKARGQPGQLRTFTQHRQRRGQELLN